MYRIIGFDGKEYGPISADQLRRWIAEGRANATTPARAEGATDWKSLGSFPEFSMLFAATPPAVTGPTSYRPKSSGFAVTGLTLGIISLTFGLCCCYGAPFNITGLIFSILALAQIRNNPERYSGQAMAIAGLVLCLISMALMIFLMIVAGISAGLGQMSHHVYRL